MSRRRASIYGQVSRANSNPDHTLYKNDRWMKGEWDIEEQVTLNIQLMLQSHLELARILEAERQVSTHVSRVVHAIPDQPDGFGTGEGAVELSLELTKGIAAYLSSLGDLTEAVADHLEIAMAEIREASEEHE